MRLVFCLAAILFVNNAYPQHPGTRYFLPGKYGEPVLPVTGNPASLGRNPPLSVSIKGGKAFFLVPELSVSAILPVKDNAFNLQLQHSGNARHNDTGADLAYGRRFSGNISAGICFGLVQRSIPGYLKIIQGSVGGGVLVQLTKNLITGMNMRKTVVSANTEKFWPAIYHAGAGYTVSDLLILSAEIEKAEDKPACFRSGIQYRFREDLFATIGVTTGTGSWFFGSGVRHSSYAAEVTFIYHPQLGWSPALTLVFQKKNKSNEEVR